MARKRRSRASHVPRRLIVASLVAAFVLGAVFAILAARMPNRERAGRGTPDSGLPPDFLADATPPSPPPVPPAPGVRDSVPGNGTATAPDGYPIKGNARSGIYHVPGGFAYGRTVATEFYRTAEAAEAAGLRASKS